MDLDADARRLLTRRACLSTAALVGGGVLAAACGASGFEQPRDSSVRLYVWALGGEARKKDNTKTTYAPREISGAITFWADLATRQRYAPTPQEASDKKLGIPQGNFGMWFNTASRAFDAQVGGKFEWD